MDDLLPLSALQHYLYCPRQCALIHLEGVWEENRFTAEGRLLHRRVDAGLPGARGGVAEDRSVPVRSERLGLYGIADLVERRENGASAAASADDMVYPVEYKRGSPKVEDWDRAQLCAQAMCLEEMLCCEIPDGALFYGEARRRVRVPFTPELREEVRTDAAQMHDLYRRGRTPQVKPTKSCNACSLKDLCLPRLSRTGSVHDYLRANMEDTP